MGPTHSFLHYFKGYSAYNGNGDTTGRWPPKGECLATIQGVGVYRDNDPTDYPYALFCKSFNYHHHTMEGVIELGLDKGDITLDQADAIRAVYAFKEGR